jgi:hypothetical protein
MRCGTPSLTNLAQRHAEEQVLHGIAHMVELCQWHDACIPTSRPFADNCWGVFSFIADFDEGKRCR